MAQRFSRTSLDGALALVPTEGSIDWNLDAPSRPPSANLQYTLSRISAFDTQLTEAAKILLIDTLLLEIVPDYPTLKVFKGISLQSATFTGVADYLIAPRRETLRTPLLCAVEAKRDNFIAGQAQCITEMVACRENNQAENFAVDVHGIVSNGQGWQFYKLTIGSDVWKSNLYTASDLPRLLGVIDCVVAACAANLPAPSQGAAS